MRESVIEGHRLIKEALPHGTWNVVPRGSNEPDPVTGVRPMHPPAGASHCFPSQSFAHSKLSGARASAGTDSKLIDPRKCNIEALASAVVVWEGLPC